ncbi:MAG: B12-binding domain-containing radical SAM protein [Desulfamplus sp.]|nr:B12-binding domain-containing radical SAM protein [Desulfamplus sp.]
MKYLFFYIDSQTDSAYTSGLGIASLSGYLKKHGHYTSLVYYKRQNDFKYALDKIKKEKPHIICFYSTSVGFQTVNFLSEKIRKKFPDIFQIYGGIHAILQPESIYKIPTLDAICTGYGETPLLNYGNAVHNSKHKDPVNGIWLRPERSQPHSVLKTAPHFPDNENPDKYLNFDYQIFLDEFSRFSDFKRKDYRLEIIFNRTCPFDCSFCCNKRLREIYNNNKFITSPEKSFAFLKETIEKIDVESIVFHDDILTLHKKWFHPFMEAYARDIKKPFVCNLRAGCFGEEEIKLLKKANVRSVWIGVESGNDFVLNQIMNKQVTKKQLVEAFQLFKKYNIPAFTQNIIGLPFETPEMFMDTIRLNAQLNPHESRISIFFPYPTTALHTLCEKHQFIGKQSDSFVERQSSILKMPHFSKNQIQLLYNNFPRLIKYQKDRNSGDPFAFIPLKAATVKLILLWIKIMQQGKKYYQETIKKYSRYKNKL